MPNFIAALLLASALGMCVICIMALVWRGSDDDV